jgi:hypothetical protein
MFFYSEPDPLFWRAPTNPFELNLDYDIVRLRNFQPESDTGRSIDMTDDGKYIVVGQPGYNTDGSNSLNRGRVYIYERGEDNSWSNEYILATGTAMHQNLGKSVSISGNGDVVAAGYGNVAFFYEKTGPFQWTYLYYIIGVEDINFNYDGNLFTTHTSSQIKTYKRNSAGETYTLVSYEEGMGQTSLTQIYDNGVIFQGRSDGVYVWSETPSTGQGWIKSVIENPLLGTVEDTSIGLSFFKDKTLVISQPDMTYEYASNEFFKTGGFLVYKNLEYLGLVDTDSDAGIVPKFQTSSKYPKKVQIENISYLTENDAFPIWIEMSGDGNYIYAMHSDDSEGGRVRVLAIEYEELDNNRYVMGRMFDNAGAGAYGTSIACSNDGKVVAVSAYRASAPSVNSGEVFVYSRKNNT